MTDHKFTDDDVIKALELCSKLDFSFKECDKCPYKGECGTKDGNMPADALALINRQMRELDDLKRDTIPKLQNGLERANYYGLKADEEIEHLKAEIESLQAVHADMTESLRLAAEANKDMQAEIAEYQKHIDNDIIYVNRVKAEAIKEFAQRLKENETKSCSWCVHSKHGTRSEKCDNFFPTHQRAYCLNYDRWESKIDTLVKEMTEESK